jgi:hypothetical protein
MISMTSGTYGVFGKGRFRNWLPFQIEIAPHALNVISSEARELRLNFRVCPQFPGDVASHCEAGLQDLACLVSNRSWPAEMQLVG